MNHRKNEHPSDKPCRYFKEGKCNFTASECWYAHAVKPQGLKNPSCENESNEGFQMTSKNLPPDMKKLIDQLIKMSSKTMN